MTSLVKICGITNANDAQAAIAERADLLGFIFVEASPRSISPAKAKEVIESLPKMIQKVGVFQNEDLQKVRDIATELHLDYVQLHGQESPDYCSQINLPIIKVLELTGDEPGFEAFTTQCNLYKDVAELILIDRPKNSPKSASEWLNSTVAFLKNVKIDQLSILMAGGLNGDNIRFVIEELAPYGIDCASGVEESPGIKDHKKLKQFMTAIKGELVS